MKTYYCTLLFGIYMFFNSIDLYAIDKLVAINATWTKTEIRIKNREDFNNVLKLNNLSTAEAEVYITVQHSEAVFFLKKLPTKIKLAPMEKLDLQIIGTKIQETNEPIIIRANLSFKGMPAQLFSEFAILPEEGERKISIIFNQPVLYFSDNVDTLKMVVKMKNYTDQTQLIKTDVMVSPSGILVNKSEIPNKLDAFESKIIVLKIFKDDNYKNFIKYLVDIRFFDSKENIIAQSRFPVSSISSYYDYQNLDQRSLGEFRLSYRTLKGYYNISDVQYTDQIKFDEGELSFQLRNLSYLSQNYNQLVNSFVQYENKKSKVRLGQIYTNGELNTFGNGIQLEHRTSKNITHHLSGLVNNDINFGSLNFFPNAKKIVSYGLKYEMGASHLAANINYINESAINSEGLLFGSNYYKPLKYGYLSIFGGFSQQFNTINAEPRTSMSVGLNSSQKIKNFTYTGNLLFSGKNYLGQNRGQQLVNNQFTYKFSNDEHFFLKQDWYLNETIGFIIGNGISYENENYQLSYELKGGTNNHLFNLGSYKEKVSDFLLLRPKQLRVTNFAYQWGFAQKQQHLQLYAEVGTSQFKRKDTKYDYLSFQFKSNYEYKNFYMQIRLQQGLLRVNTFDVDRPENYQYKELMAGYSYRLFNQKLIGRVRYGVFKENIFETWRHRVGATVDYKISNVLKANFNYEKLANIQWNIPEFTAGIIYNIRLIKSPINKNLNLKVFYDENGNQKKDDVEKWADNLPLNFNAQPLKTDDNGKLKVKNIKKGNYTLKFDHNKQNKVLIDIKNSNDILVPLKPLMKVSGVLEIRNTDGNISLDYDKERLIYFINEAGDEFISFTDEKGNYNILIPKGEYKIYVNGFNNVYEENSKNQKIEIKEDVSDLKIIALIKERKVKLQVLKSN